MRHGSLFSGIGGFDLAAEWMGWENIFHCEINKFCQKVLKYHFPNSVLYEDITTTDFSEWRGKIDIITGGDPCQPHSLAGLGKGKADDRYLWPEYYRALREIRPTWGVNENVFGSVTNGIIDIKINDLESIGYACQAYYIPAESVGALHQRERIWLIAYNADFDRNNKIPGGLPRSETEKRALEEKQYKVHKFREPVDLRLNNSDSDAERFKELNAATESRRIEEGISRYFGFGDNPHGNFTRHEIESAIIRMLNGLPEGLDYTERNQRIKALGNAIVPQIAFEIFKAIEQFESTIPPKVKTVRQ